MENKEFVLDENIIDPTNHYNLTMPLAMQQALLEGKTVSGQYVDSDGNAMSTRFVVEPFKSDT